MIACVISDEKPDNCVV